MPLFKAVHRQQTVESEEYIIHTEKNTALHLLISAGPIMNDAGETIGAIAIWQDITELKKTENSLKESRQNLLNLKEHLENKNKELESIIGVVSHDLRSPLVSIGGFSHEIEFSCDAARKILMQQDLTPERIAALRKIIEGEIPEFLNFILSSTAKMDALVRSLVKVARAGMAEIRPELLDMNQLIEDASAAIGFEIKESATDLQIEELPGCFADRTQTSQIFSNLLDNAIKYLDPNRRGQIRVSGKTEGNRSVFCIKDNGIGIASQHLEHIFDLFSRLDRSKASGEGIGLALVKRMVARNNGSIWVESDVGKGTCFCVCLPRLADQ
jgi:signal transduction histidine kinase